MVRSNGIRKRGAGHEEQTVEAWTDDNPGTAGTIALP